MALHNTCLKMTIIGLSVQNIRTNRYILHTHDVDAQYECTSTMGQRSDTFSTFIFLIPQWPRIVAR